VTHDLRQLVDDALIEARWEGKSNPLSETVRKLCDAIETLSEPAGTEQVVVMVTGQISGQAN